MVKKISDILAICFLACILAAFVFFGIAVLIETGDIIANVIDHYDVFVTYYGLTHWLINLAEAVLVILVSGLALRSVVLAFSKKKSFEISKEVSKILIIIGSAAVAAFVLYIVTLIIEDWDLAGGSIVNFLFGAGILVLGFIALTKTQKPFAKVILIMVGLLLVFVLSCNEGGTGLWGAYHVFLIIGTIVGMVYEVLANLDGFKAALSDNKSEEKQEAPAAEEAKSEEVAEEVKAE